MQVRTYPLLVEEEVEVSEEVSEEMAGQDGAHLRPSAGPYICARYDVPPPRALRAYVRAAQQQQRPFMRPSPGGTKDAGTRAGGTAV